MKKIKIYLPAIIIFSAMICIFAACKKNDPVPVTSTTAAEQVSTTKSNGYTYNDKFILSEETTRYIHTAPPVPTAKPKVTDAESEKSDEPPRETITITSDNKVDEHSHGLDILSKTSPVVKGNNASVIITGTPEAEYTIEFYETETQKAAYSGLETAKADSNGIASWTFNIESSCPTGERKIIIREKNSDKYIRTSITVI